MNVNKARLSKYLRIFLWSIFFTYLVLFIYLVNITKEPNAGIDFTLFYAAGKMAMEGIPSDAYDIMKHHQVIEGLLGIDLSFHLIWLYPPIFLLFIMPFVMIPLRVAATLWVILGLALYIYTLDKVSENRKIFYIGLLYQGVFINLKWAQNGFILVFLLGAALYFLDKKPRISGLLFALLCFKPHFALLAIIVLMFSKEWKVFTWGTISVVALVAFSGILFGLETWFAYFNMQFNSPSIVLESSWAQTSALQITLYSTLKLLGFGKNIAIGLQGLLSIAVLISTVIFWRWSPKQELKNALLVVGTFLFVPYAMQYDLTLLILPICWYMQACEQSKYEKWEIALIVVLWCLPVLNWFIVLKSSVQIAPVVLIIFYMAIFTRGYGSHKSNI